MTTPMIEIMGVHKFFGDLHVLKGVDMTVQQGEVCVMLGPSGSGKSTLLRCINGLETISAGRVYLEGGCWVCAKRSMATGHCTNFDKEVSAQLASEWCSSASTCSLT